MGAGLEIRTEVEAGTEGRTDDRTLDETEDRAPEETLTPIACAVCMAQTEVIDPKRMVIASLRIFISSLFV